MLVYWRIDVQTIEINIPGFPRYSFFGVYEHTGRKMHSSVNLDALLETFL